MPTCSTASGLANDPGPQTRSAADPGRGLAGQSSVTVGTGLHPIDVEPLDDAQRRVNANEFALEALARIVGGSP